MDATPTSPETVATNRPNTEEPVMSEAPRCYAFEWIGQPFSSCNNCGKPYWEHTHDSRSQRRDGTSVPFGHRFHKAISKEEAQACKKKWGRS
jgi:hypothetical protein